MDSSYTMYMYMYNLYMYTVQFQFIGHSLDLSDYVLHDWLFPHHLDGKEMNYKARVMGSNPVCVLI